MKVLPRPAAARAPCCGHGRVHWQELKLVRGPAAAQALGREVGTIYTRSELKHLIGIHVENPEHQNESGLTREDHQMLSGVLDYRARAREAGSVIILLCSLMDCPLAAAQVVSLTRAVAMCGAAPCSTMCRSTHTPCACLASMPACPAESGHLTQLHPERAARRRRGRVAPVPARLDQRPKAQAGACAGRTPG